MSREKCLTDAIAALTRRGASKETINRARTDIDAMFASMEQWAKDNNIPQDQIALRMKEFLTEKRRLIKTSPMRALRTKEKVSTNVLLVDSVADKEYGGSKFKAIEDLLIKTDRQREGFAPIETSIRNHVSTGVKRINKIAKKHGLLDRLENHELDLDIRKIRAGDVDATTNPALRELSQAFDDVQKWNRAEGIAQGRDIMFLENRGDAQHHYFNRMKLEGDEKWIADAKQAYDFEKMTVSPAEIDGFLRTQWMSAENRFSKPYSSLDTEFQAVTLNLPGRKDMSSRKIIFKSGEARHNYELKYGEPSVLKNNMNELKGEARATALARNFGPNPDSGFKAVLDGADLSKKHRADLQSKYDALKHGYDYSNPAKSLKETIDGIKADVKVAEGTIDKFAVGGKSFFKAMLDNPRLLVKPTAQTMRKLGDMSMLHQSLYATMSDNALSAAVIASQTGGSYLKAGWKYINTFVKTLPANKRDEIGEVLGVFAEETTRAFRDTNRLTGEIIEGGKVTWNPKTWTINNVHKGYMHLTYLQQQSFHARNTNTSLLAAELNNDVGKTFGQLNRGKQKGLKSIGIGEKEWDIAKNATERLNALKTNIVSPDKIQELPNSLFRDVYGKDFTTSQISTKKSDISNSLYTYLSQLSESGSPLPGMKEAHWLDAMDQNAIHTQVLRFMLQYSSFPRAVLGSMQSIYNLGGARTVAPTILAASVSGFAVHGLKQALAGREIDFTDPELYIRSGLQGGSLGIAGDYFLMEYDPMFNTFASKLGGPVVSKFGNTLAPIFSAAIRGDVEAKKVIDAFFKVAPKVPYVGAYMNREIQNWTYKLSGIDAYKPKVAPEWFPSTPDIFGLNN